MYFQGQQIISKPCKTENFKKCVISGLYYHFPFGNYIAHYETTGCAWHLVNYSTLHNSEITITYQYNT